MGKKHAVVSYEALNDSRTLFMSNTMKRKKDKCEQQRKSGLLPRMFEKKSQWQL